MNLTMKSRLTGFFLFALLCPSLAIQPALAQMGAQSSAPKTYYEQVHSYQPGKGTFYKDPNVWVLTPEFAERAGMPKEWASTELQGAEAVAFRYEQDGAEEECGWMGDPKRCAPVFQCVLEVYFDNAKHKLPWDENRPVTAYDRSHSSARHLYLPRNPYLPADRKPTINARSPFTDPVSGRELRFNNLRAKAYDRDLYAGLSMVKLDLGGCHGLYRIMPKPGEGHILELKESCDLDCYRNPPAKMIYHRVVLPYEWRVRVATLLKVDAERWKSMTREAVQTILEENKK